MRIMTKVLFIWFLLIFSLNNLRAQTKDPPPNGETKVKTLISQLYQYPWIDAKQIASPMTWEFNFSRPMKDILKIGNPAQDELLKRVSDDEIKKQIR